MSLNVEHLAPRDSLLARCDPRWRLAAIIVGMVAVSVLHSPTILGVALASAMALAGLARVPRRWFLVRLTALLFTLMPFLILLPFIVDRGGPTLHILGMHLSMDGVLAALALVCKSLTLVALVLVLLAAAPLHVTLRAAMKLGIPSLLVQLTMLSYRYLFLILDELNRIRVAVRVRGFRNRMNRHSYHTIGQVAGTLLVRSAERAERVAQAMRCRGFDGTYRSLDEWQTRARDVLFFAATVLACTGFVCWEYFD